jgi:hypothetical protein
MMIVCACNFVGVQRHLVNLLRLHSRETNVGRKNNFQRPDNLVDQENRLIHHELPEPILFENASGLLLFSGVDKSSGRESQKDRSKVFLKTGKSFGFGMKL